MKFKFILSILIVLNLYHLINGQIFEDDCKCKLKSRKRIVGGRETPHEIAWQVSLALDNGTYHNHICGGTIINHVHIMTAAHCVQFLDTPEKLKTLKIRVGLHKLDDPKIKEKTYDVKKVTIDKRYNPKENGASGIGDFAIIELEKTLNFKERGVEPACLPSKTEHYDDKVGSLLAVGWGSVRRNIRTPIGRSKSKISNVLKEAYFNYNEKCADYLVCINPLREGDSVCNGDSGGGLLHTLNGVTRVVGIAQFVTGYTPEDDKDTTIFCHGPGGYGRVSFYMPLLEKIVKLENNKNYCSY